MKHSESSRRGGSRSREGASLVFISHDSRDAKLAEEFAQLLKRVSSNKIDVFWSSDTSGIEGIPYGQIWVTAILSKIEAAAGLVCLMTRHSIDRPWVLWEAGVATGKGKPVYGVPVGLSLKEACTGPFALFQNCRGDHTSLVGLIATLLRSLREVPNPFLLDRAVEDFLSRKDEMLPEEEPQALRPYPDVVTTLKKMKRNLFAIDGFIEISKSLGYSGWARQHMAPPQIIPQRALPIEFQDYAGNDARCLDGSQSRYSLRSISEPLHDAGSKIETVLAQSEYADVYKLSRLMDHAFVERDGQKWSGRSLYGYSWHPLEQSPLIHNVNAQPIVITCDNKVILAKRASQVHHYPNCWSASIEEQMVADGDKINPPDRTYFDCAERGVREELGCTPIPSTTRILSVGIEHKNLSASFICVLRVQESFKEVCEKWLNKARDPFEAAAIDCIMLERDCIAELLKHRSYKSGKEVCIRTDGGEGDWHPTARMRLYALSCYLESQKIDVAREQYPIPESKSSDG